MTAAAGEPYAGLPVAEARERVVADLDAQGLIRAREEYVHAVPYSNRSGERVEPLISLQWFMRMDELAAPAIDVVSSGRVRIHPESQSKRYLDWLAEIRPWCISRQLWWGHQIPVWYRAGETYCGLEPPEGEGWEQDPDVLDTWFSSALWPFVTLGWPEDTPQLRAFYPTDVLSTGRDILFLWVARMVMMGLRFPGEIPFSDVYVHSIIQAPDGRRMTKSLGTGIDPLDLIEGGPRPPVYSSSSPATSPPTAPTRCASACWRCPRRRTCASARRRSSRGRRWRTSSTTRRGSSRCAWGHRRRRGARRAGDGPSRGAAAADRRGPLDPLAPAGDRGRHARADRRLRLRQGRARLVRLRLRRPVRLVFGTRQAAPGRGRRPRRARGARRDAAARPARDDRDRPPDHPVRHRGAVGPARLCAGRGPARHRPPARARRGTARRGRRGRDGPRDRGDQGAARVARLRRRQGRHDRAGRAARPRLRRDRDADRGPRPLRAARP